MNIYQKASELILGSRLKRLSDRLLSDVSKAYKIAGIDFEPAWFPVFFLLNHHKTQTVSHIASQLEITQSGASQMVNSLVNKGLVEYIQNSNDKRVRTIAFTSEGKKLLEKIKPMWIIISNCFNKIFSEGENSKVILSSLEEIENILSQKSLLNRINEVLQKKKMLTEIQFSPFKKELEESYKKYIFNEFIKNENFNINNSKLLNDVDQEIKKQKAEVILVSFNSQIIGCSVSTININNYGLIEIFILNKEWQNLNIEEQLLIKTIDFFKLKKINNITAQINKEFSSILLAFKNFGFNLQDISNINENTFLKLEKKL